MEIGVDSSRANHENRTGTEWYSYELLQAWRRTNSTHHFTLYFEDSPRTDLSIWPENFRIRILRWPPRSLWTLARFSLTFLGRQPDVLFIPAHTMPIIHPSRTVVTVHDLGFEHFPELYRTERIGGRLAIARFLFRAGAAIASAGRYSNTELDYQRWSIRYAAKHATSLISVSAFTKGDLVRTLHCPPEKITVIPNGVNHHRYRPVTDRRRIEQTLHQYGIHQPYFLSIGRLEEKKNTVRLIQAFADFHRLSKRKHSLVLAGTPGFGVERIEEAIVSTGMKERIVRLGWVPEEYLPTLLTAAEAFVFPSLYEGFGIPVIEAMACGTPVISSNTTSIPEIAGHAALLVDPTSTNAITSAMTAIADFPARRRELQQLGINRASNFSWERCAHQTLAFLKTVAEQPPSRR